MEKIIELTKKESIDVNGGGAYEVGYKIGKLFANLLDWYAGFADGFKEGFDKSQ